jgi:hypothetical protein
MDDGYAYPSAADIIQGITEKKVKVCRRNPIPVLIDNINTHWCGEHLESPVQNE